MPGRALPRRGGFTLVELLVAMGIILVLVALAVLVANTGLVENYQMTNGSDRVSGWLLQARAKAQRDGAPRGVRFIVDPVTGFCREAQLIEVPDPINLPPGNQLMIEQSAGGKRLYVVGPNATEVQTSIAPGDTLSIPSLGTIHRVVATPAASVTIGGNSVTAVEVRVVDASKIPDLGAAASGAAGTPTYATDTFGFIRQARAAFGEPPLLVPDGIAISLNLANTTNPADTTNPSLSLIPNVNGNFDVVFGPNGEILNAGSLGRIMLWVRNPDALTGSPRAGGDLRTTYEQAGEMTLITVYTKTGAVAIHPVALPVDDNPATPHDPYAFSKDGIASGL